MRCFCSRSGTGSQFCPDRSTLEICDFFDFCTRSPAIWLFSIPVICLERAFRRLLRFVPPPGPKKNSIGHFEPALGSPWAPDRAPGASSEAALAAEHAFGTPLGPARNRSARKMKLLILAGFYHLNWSPDVVLPIKDSPKRPPMGLINF